VTKELTSGTHRALAIIPNSCQHTFLLDLYTMPMQCPCRAQQRPHDPESFEHSSARGMSQPQPRLPAQVPILQDACTQTNTTQDERSSNPHVEQRMPRAHCMGRITPAHYAVSCVCAFDSNNSVRMALHCIVCGVLLTAMTQPWPVRGAMLGGRCCRTAT
jgi:hypothetical protein